jgi:hypothetical protein
MGIEGLGANVPKPIQYRLHAEQAMAERAIEREWVERTVNAPERTEPDPDPELQRRFRAIPERDGRILRVVCAENDAIILVVTACLDRRARRPA